MLQQQTYVPDDPKLIRKIQHGRPAKKQALTVTGMFNPQQFCDSSLKRHVLEWNGLEWTEQARL
jgi:hypothetical protein